MDQGPGRGEASSCKPQACSFKPQAASCDKMSQDKMTRRVRQIVAGTICHVDNQIDAGGVAKSLKLQAASLKFIKLDKPLGIGYYGIKKKEKRTYAQLNESRPRTVVTRRKYCSRNCSALEATAPGTLIFSKIKNFKMRHIDAWR